MIEHSAGQGRRKGDRLKQFKQADASWWGVLNVREKSLGFIPQVVRESLRVLGERHEKLIQWLRVSYEISH